MRFGASKKVNEDGIASYMSIESVHNLWIMCRHLVSGAVWLYGSNRSTTTNLSNATRKDKPRRRSRT